MGQITVEFKGICTHFQQTDHPTLPVKHRVVVLRADILNMPPIRDKVIPPHFASLSFSSSSSLAVLPLTGCTLSFANAAGDLRLENFELMPSLTILSDDTLGPASEPVLFGKNPLVTACWFDFDHGQIKAVVSPNFEVATQVTVETDGDPLLTYRPFPTVIYPPPSDILIQPDPGGTVLVQNTAMPHDEIDSEFHFYLNYLTATQLPPVMKLPNGPPGTGGPGCSNSNYP
jgi:hypothetical protein